jgi:hypothetical protein
MHEHCNAKREIFPHSILMLTEFAVVTVMVGVRAAALTETVLCHFGSENEEGHLPC